MKRVVRFVGGLLLCAVLISPLRTLDLSAFADLTAKYRAVYEDYEGKGIFAETGFGTHAAEIIEARTAAYILEWAAALGIDCEVEVRCARGDGDYPYPYALRGRVPVGTDLEALERLKRQIRAELCIEEQQWTEK